MTKPTNITVNINATSNNSQYYITVKGQKIPCSREVYLTMKRPGRKEAMRQYRGQRPFINGQRCQEDCSKCPHHIAGYGCTNKGDVSFDELYEAGEVEPVAPTSVEDEVSLKITIEAMYNELQSEDERCREIFSLMIVEKPQREIALELGISPGTVSWYIKKIRKCLDKFR